MAEFWVQKMAKHENDKYVLIGERTREKLNYFGLGDWEVYILFACWDYVERMSSDKKAMDELKKLLSDKKQKPLIVRKYNKTMKMISGKHDQPSKNFSTENFFNGTSWYGFLCDAGNAWIVYCYTRDLNLN